MLSKNMTIAIINRSYFRDKRTLNALHRRGLICSIHWNSASNQWTYRLTTRGINVRRALITLSDRELDIIT